MVDWRSSMKQTFEYYVVDPGTWKDSKRIANVKTCTINRDMEADTKGSATIDTEDMLGECYFRAYLITIQNGERNKHPLGTFLVQTPSSSFDGKTTSTTMDAYTPLIELKEKQPPLGYAILKNADIMKVACQITTDNVRAPVITTSSDKTLHSDFVADTNDTWMTFGSDLISNANFSYGLDELGRIIFEQDQELDSMQPVWTYDDGNCSILYPSFSMQHDMFGIPNEIEVVYSDDKNTFYAKVTNDDPFSPTSTVSRGRVIPYRITDPKFAGTPSEDQVRDYAERMLKSVSTIEYTISYTHGYCPVRIGDCVRLNVDMGLAGKLDVKARVISQNIKCEPGTPVTEKAVYTTKLWR